MVGLFFFFFFRDWCKHVLYVFVVSHISDVFAGFPDETYWVYCSILSYLILGLILQLIDATVCFRSLNCSRTCVRVCFCVCVCVYMGWVCVNIILVKKKGTAQASIYSTLLISGEALDVSIHIHLDVATQRDSPFINYVYHVPFNVVRSANAILPNISHT